MGTAKGYHPDMLETEMSGEELRAIRERAGLTQGKFADAIGIHEKSLTRLEGGGRRVRPTLRKLVLALFRQPRVVQEKRRVVAQSAKRRK